MRTFEQSLPKDFFKKYWKKRPVVLKNPFDKNFCEPDDIFQGLLNVTERYKNKDTSTLCRIFSGPELIWKSSQSNSKKKQSLLAHPSDRSFEGYYKRLKKNYSPTELGTVFNNFQGTSWPLWRNAVQFIEGLSKNVTTLPGGAVLDLFFGNYRKSQSGFHKDNQDVFTFIIKGNKKFLTWPYKIMSKHPHFSMSDIHHCVNLKFDFDYEHLRKDAIVLQGKPGDVFYWPASYWHVGESDGKFAATLSLGLFPNKKSSPNLYGFKVGPPPL